MKKPKILIIDDHDLPIIVQKKMWKSRFKLSPDSVKDAREAIGLIGKNKYNLIICDLNMPTYNGYDFIKFIREQGCKTPIIVVSAARSVVNVNKAISSGADEYIVKPIDENVYFTKVAKFIELKDIKSE